jgi:hypothetical protein
VPFNFSRIVALVRKSATLLGFCLLVVQAAPYSFANEPSWIGRWAGTYSCGNIRNNHFSLDITAQSANRVEGLFSFNVPAAPGETGAYKVVGRSGSDGRVTFVPQEWLSVQKDFNRLDLLQPYTPMARCLRGTFLIADLGRTSALPAKEIRLQGRLSRLTCPSYRPPPLAAVSYRGSGSGG